jgi:hypothetical protein
VTYMLLWAVGLGLGIAIGYSHAEMKHAMFMRDGWLYLRNVAMVRDVEVEDIGMAFGAPGLNVRPLPPVEP